MVLAVLAAAAIVAFMTLGARGSWSFILPFRGAKLAALLLVAVSIAVSTVIFQTVTNNRILTPSIMGFDALYVLIQTVLVFFLGAVQVSAADPRLLFVAEAAIMTAFAGLLYRWLFTGAVRSLHLLMLVGIVFGIFFRSISSFLQRIIDPSEFLVLQDRLFASFNTVDSTLLGISALIVMLAVAVVWRLLPVLDVLALGRETAIALGVDHRRMVAVVLILVTVLVAVSTALVGPVTFFGLLVANLAYLAVPSARHRVVLPVAALLAIIFLVGGQVILERVLAFDTALSIVIEFVGGLVFIVLVVRGAAR
ncbi:iron chelate uptake ABC transporter family permease subunit [Aquamicrobium sp. LC103]|uniref:iron chelate uptake ABC transporter family permease subunit n=1 Tax=Aquamicrobium sp. LC103 TaxID=1120658 RepID=UPI001FED3EB1|nr:iron chelate uptake ABC transporter family permease subunit [Aquamicrobium sp. LC103]